MAVYTCYVRSLEIRARERNADVHTAPWLVSWMARAAPSDYVVQSGRGSAHDELSSAWVAGNETARLRGLVAAGTCRGHTMDAKDWECRSAAALNTSSGVNTMAVAPNSSDATNYDSIGARGK